MKKILIIQLSRIGDIIQTVPLQANIKKNYPDCKISLLCVKEFQSIVTTFDDIDSCIGLTAELTHQLKSLNQNSPDLIKTIIDSIHIVNNFDLLINCNLEIGVACLASEINATIKKGRVYNSSIPMYINGDWGKYLFAFTQFRKQNFFNMADIYANMANLPIPQKEKLYILSDTEKNEAKTILKKHGYTEDKKLIIFQLGSSKNARSWGIKNFSELANRITKNKKIQILITGSLSENELAEEFCRKTDFPVINLTGKTTLKQLPGILSYGNLMITNDTGPMHIAALVNTPLIVINLATAYFAETAPYGKNHIIVHADLPCYPCLPGKECAEIKCREIITPEIIEQISICTLSEATKSFPDYSGIQIYKTEICNNSMLNLFPLYHNVGEHYIEGFINRLFWEFFMNDSQDTNYIKNVIKIIKGSNCFKDNIHVVIPDLELIENLLSKGNSILNSIEMEFLKDPINQEKINLLLQQFQSIESHFSNNQNSIYKIYHLLDLGSIEQKQFTVMVQQIHQKYKKNWNKIKLVLGKFSELIGA